MSTRSLSGHNNDANRFASATVLPNTAGGAVYDGLEVGSTAWVDDYIAGLGRKFYCVDPTPGSAIWIPEEPRILALGSNTRTLCFDDANYYTLNSDPLAVASGMFGILFSPQLGLEDYDVRNFAGTRNGTGAAGGGVCFHTTAGFNPITIGFSLRTDTGNLREVGWTDRSLVGKWIFAALTWSHAAGVITVRFYINGTPVNEGTVAGNTVGAGGDLTLGTTAEGVIAGQDGANETWFNGMIYKNDGAPSYDQMGELSRLVMEAGALVDTAGVSLTDGWRRGVAPPGATFASFLGGANLARVGLTPNAQDFSLIYG